MSTCDVSVHCDGLVSLVQDSARGRRIASGMKQRLCQWNFVFAVALLWLATAIAGRAQTFTSLASFNTNDGKTPKPPLVQGLDGNIYGLTQAGGRFKGPFCGSGCGTIFKITPDGTLTMLYAFCSQTNCVDGISPMALVLATDGNFYGTTGAGGNSGTACTGGCGTFFKLSLNGTLTTLYSFACASTCADGAGPGGLIQASDGNFYGTTAVGGAYSSLGGTIFRISPSGVLTTLHSFCALSNCTDGRSPLGGVIQATNGKLYGTTSLGGTHLGQGGTIFSITLSGQFTKLYDFCSQPRCTDGSSPQAPPIQAANGVLYGTTSSGGSLVGCGFGCGTIFKLTAGGAVTTAYRFCSETNCLDGKDPNALLQATDGNLYGTTYAGGARGYCNTTAACGTIFKISNGGVLTTLYNFCSESSCTDGRNPDGLMQSTDGSFYGTTATGGIKGPGSVFNLSVGLGAFGQTLPNSGKVGTEVTILGTNLTGATNVSFHGTAATFTVVSPTQITTTVPTGATTGAVTVTTPSGTLKSDMVFRIP